MAYDYFNKPASLGYTYGAKKTLDDLEKDENFLEVSERFLQSVGENSDDVFEYLRDSDFNLASGMSRAMQSGKFNEQQKQDYAYLRKEFDNADLGSLKQFAGLVKDAGIDIATDPTFIVAALAAPFTGGTSLASRTAIGTTGLKVAKNFVGPTPAFVGPARVAAGSLKEEGKKAVTKAATVGALEAGAWLGLDNHFRQTTELNTDIRKLYSLPELAGSTTLGVLTGGLVGGGIQKANLYYSKMSRLYSDDEYLKTTEGSLSDKFYKTLEIIDKAKGSVIPIGSATSLLDTKAKFSPTTRLLGNLAREDFDRKFTSVTTKKVELGHGEMLDNLRSQYHRVFDEATAPLRKTGAFKESDELAVIRIMRGAKPEKYGAEVQQVAKDLEAFFNKIFDDAVDAGLIQEERKLANYFPRSWNRKAIEDNRTVFQQKLIDEKIVKDEAEASNLVDGMLNKRNELFSSHSVLLTQARAFKNLDDNAFEAFLTTDFNTAINYYMNAAHTIQHKKSFLLPKFTRKSNVEQFKERFIDPMDKELREARGQGRGLTSSDRKSIIKLYKSITGQVNYFDSGLMQGVYDATKLANSVAYLPLATVSSLTEALIPLTKTGGSVTGPAKDALKGVAEGHKIFVQDIPGLLKTKYKMKDSDIQKEMQQVFMGMDEAFAESTNRLTGEGLQNEALKKIGRGFFRLNMLTPWTKSVQLASFNIGKGLIRENLEALDKLAKEGVDIFDESKLMSQVIADKRAKVKSTSKIRDVQLLKSELYDLGIDVEDGIRWLNDGAKTTFGAERKDGVLTGEIKYADDFYKSVVQGAGRFVNEVIMPVGRDRARIPVFMTNPKVDILTQFLRYPAVFSNTVLKNYIRSAIVNPKVNGAKMGAFALMTVNIALATNYWRSNKENKDRIVEEGLEGKDIRKAFQRVGLLGPLDYGYRFSDSLEYTKNPAVSSISLGGPVMTDTLGLLLGRRGVTETLARKAPLIGTAGMVDTYFGEYFEENPYDELIKKAKEIDKEGNYLLGIKDRPKDRKYTRTYERSYTRNYATGGLVKGKDDVPQTKENPADRVDPNTGKPYSDQMGRLGLNIGGMIAKQVSKKLTGKPKGIKAYHGSPVEFDEFNTEFLKTGEGVNAFGKGLYFTETEDIAKGYKKTLSKKKEVEELEKKEFNLNEEYNKIIDKKRAGKTIQKKDIKKARLLMGEMNDVIYKANSIASGLTEPTMFPGKMYEVNIKTSPKKLFDWDKTMSKQSVEVQDAAIITLQKLSDDELEFFVGKFGNYPAWTRDEFSDRQQLMFDAKVILDDMKGEDFLLGINQIVGKEKGFVVEDVLLEKGVPGIQYNDGFSRSKTKKKSKNYVIFDARIIDISKKYGITIPAAGKLLMEMDAENKEEGREPFNQGGLAQTILSAIQKDPDRNYTDEEIQVLEQHADYVGNAESDRISDRIQMGGGPGRGKYQYEISTENKPGQQGAKTAVNRYINLKNKYGIPLTKEDMLLSQDKNPDFSKIPEDMQDAIFYADKAMGNMPVGDLVKGKLSHENAWADYHWSGDPKEREDKINYFVGKNY